MSEHELWNELGNLYFMTGAYKQASYAYNRSIKLENRFGRPYSNLAYAYVQQGKFAEAVDLYRSSIELLTDDKEKAVSWFRLGDVYRRLKDYRDAILAYQQADLLDPSLSQDEAEVGKVLYGASNLEASPEPIPTEAVQTRSAMPAADAPKQVLTEEAIPEPIMAEAVVIEPAQPMEITTEPVMEATISQEPVNPEVVISEMVITEEVSQDELQHEWISEVQADMTQTPQVEPEPEEILELEETENEVEANLPEFNMEVEESLPEFTEEDNSDGAQVLPDDWMLFTETELPDEPLTQWISTLNPEAEPAVVFHTPEGNYPAKDYSAETASMPADAGQAAYSDRKELMVVDVKQPMTAFVLAPSDQELPNPVETAVETVEETPQAAPVDQVEEQPGIEQQIETLRQSLEEDPECGPAWDELGELYKSIRIYKEAIPAYQKAVAIEPKNVQFLYHLGCAYAIDGFADDAVKTFQQIIKLDSSHALAHATLGGYYRKMGLEELAQKHIGKAVKNFFDTENEYNRACLQALCGNYDKAISLLRTALQTEQTYVDWVLRDPDLDSIRTDPRFKQLISDFS